MDAETSPDQEPPLSLSLSLSISYLSVALRAPQGGWGVIDPVKKPVLHESRLHSTCRFQLPLFSLLRVIATLTQPSSNLPDKSPGSPLARRATSYPRRLRRRCTAAPHVRRLRTRTSPRCHPRRGPAGAGPTRWGGRCRGRGPWTRRQPPGGRRRPRRARGAAWLGVCWGLGQWFRA